MVDGVDNCSSVVDCHLGIQIDCFKESYIRNQVVFLSTALQQAAGTPCAGYRSHFEDHVFEVQLQVGCVQTVGALNSIGVVNRLRPLLKRVQIGARGSGEQLRRRSICFIEVTRVFIHFESRFNFVFGSAGGRKNLLQPNPSLFGGRSTAGQSILSK